MHSDFPANFLFHHEDPGKFERSRKHNLSFLDNLIVTVALLLNNSTKLSKANSQRIFLAIVLFFAFIVTAIFQSIIIKNLNTNLVFGDINTLNELLDYGYQFILPDTVALIFKKVGGNRILDKLREIALNSSDQIETIESISSKDNKAILMTNFMIDGLLDQYYDNVTKKNSFKAITEVVLNFYTSVTVPKNSPFQDVLNDIVQRMVESGLHNHQLELGLSDKKSTVMIERIKSGNIPAEDQKAINVYELSSIFYVYLTLNLAAIIAFFVELVINKLAKFNKK